MRTEFSREFWVLSEWITLYMCICRKFILLCGNVDNNGNVRETIEVLHFRFWPRTWVKGTRDNVLLINSRRDYQDENARDTFWYPEKPHITALQHVKTYSHFNFENCNFVAISVVSGMYSVPIHQCRSLPLCVPASLTKFSREVEAGDGDWKQAVYLLYYPTNANTDNAIDKDFVRKLFSFLRLVFFFNLFISLSLWSVRIMIKIMPKVLAASTQKK
jgi:hypothetical protein